MVQEALDLVVIAGTESTYCDLGLSETHHSESASLYSWDTVTTVTIKVGIYAFLSRTSLMMPSYCSVCQYIGKFNLSRLLLLL